MNKGILSSLPNGAWLEQRVTPNRHEAHRPHTFRLAQYPDGRLRVQGAYAWICGLEGGETWRDLPVVQVDEGGAAL